MEQLNKFIGRFERKSTAEENQAKRGVLFPSLVQRMLIDVTKFFGLKSFDEAEKVKVADWLLVFQNEAATNLFNYNLQKIFEQKAKLKQRKK